MTAHRTPLPAALLLLCLAFAENAAHASKAMPATAAPIAVSPGAISKLAVVSDRCPTFSWGGVARADEYQLVVYRLNSEGREEEEPVLRRSFPGSVDSWTPSLEQCLERGERYAWSVRAVGAEQASKWSSPRLFVVASGPSRSEFEAAIQVVRQYLEQHENQTDSAPVGPALHSAPPFAQTRSNAQAIEQINDPIIDSDSALRGELEELSANTFGLSGFTHSSSPTGHSAGVYGEQTNSEGQSSGVYGLARSPNAFGVQGRHVGAPEHPVGVHSVGVLGHTFDPHGAGVWGIGHVAGSIGVFGHASDGGGYGGYFINSSGDLIAANPTENFVDPVFRVDNAGNVIGTSFTGFTTMDITQFTATQTEAQTLSQGTVAATCSGNQLVTGGGCDCFAGKVTESTPTSGGWRCSCDGATAKAWAICLDTP